MKEFGYIDKKLYKGCSKTSDSNTTWCYVVGGSKCPVAGDSTHEGEVRKFRECKPKECVCPWKTTPFVAKKKKKKLPNPNQTKEADSADSSDSDADDSNCINASNASDDDDSNGTEVNSSLLQSDIDPEDQCLCLPAAGPGGRRFFGFMKEPTADDEESEAAAEEPEAGNESGGGDAGGNDADSKSKCGDEGYQGYQKSKKYKYDHTSHLGYIQSHIMEVEKDIKSLSVPPKKKGEPTDSEREDEAQAEKAAEQEAQEEKYQGE